MLVLAQCFTSRRPFCSQICNIFTRLSTGGYVEALIAQGACGCLLDMLLVGRAHCSSVEAPTPDMAVAARIKYKSALCLGTIAANSYGLKAIYAQDGKCAFLLYQS